MEGRVRATRGGVGGGRGEGVRRGSLLSLTSRRRAWRSSCSSVRDSTVVSRDRADSMIAFM